MCLIGQMVENRERRTEVRWRRTEIQVSAQPLAVKQSVRSMKETQIRYELRDGKIPNHKHQITNKFQITIINDQNRCVFWCLRDIRIAYLSKATPQTNWFLFGILYFGHCNLFVVCDLEFVILKCVGTEPRALKAIPLALVPYAIRLVPCACLLCRLNLPAL